MGKISPVSAKYICHATINIEGVVDRPDVIGAIFGQTEGLLGSDLELRELQRSGRIGRIEVNVDTRGGKTKGEIVIPSSLDKAETSIVAAALEIIERIGPCNAKIQVGDIEDVRVSKRHFVVERAKELLKQMMEGTIPDSQELADEVAYSVRVMEIKEYGSDRLAAGPAIDESDEIIVVEGRADVLNLLKHGFKNAIAINGTSLPATIIELTKRKTVTIFVDGDRGGNLIIKEAMQVADIDFVSRAPDGKEVEEITKKELHKSLRSRISLEQAKLELGISAESQAEQQKPKPVYSRSAAPNAKPTAPGTRPAAPNAKPTAPGTRPAAPNSGYQRTQKPAAAPQPKFARKARALTDTEKSMFKEMLEALIGTRGAYILDEKMNILGKVPVTELATTIKSLSSGVFALVFDGVVNKDIVTIAEKINVKFIVGMDTEVKPADSKVGIITINNL